MIEQKPALQLLDVYKSFGAATAVDGVTLTVERGEFVTLLGPSGSGKTTTLRMIAGFTAPTSGAILTNGVDVTAEPPERRNIGIVFQNYALFPHLTAAQNIAFSLEMRKVSRSEIRRRVEEALAIVHLAGYGGRYPRELSGGQQQRIALARAFVYEPSILLMDEPLGALDKKLRDSLQLEIVRIARQIGATVVYVTHDQGEALTMSDRIAVFNRGRIEQIDAPTALYLRPGSRFVADFLGESTMVDGRVHPDPGGYQRFETTGFRCVVAAGAPLSAGSEATLVLRPEYVELSDGPNGGDDWNAVGGIVTEAIFAGATRRYSIRVGDSVEFLVREPGPKEPRSIGDHVWLRWRRGVGSLISHEA